MNQINKQIKIIDYIIYIFSLYYLFVDTIAGFLSTKGIPNLRQPYKIVIIFLMIFSCIAKSLNKGLLISFLFSLLCYCPLNYFLSYYANYNTSLLIIFKIVSNFIFLLYFLQYEDYEKLAKIMIVNYLVFLLNIIAGVFGFASATYEDAENSLGIKGFFIAGNEVTYTFLCLTFFLLNYIRKHRYIFYLVSFINAVLIATKACMLGTILLIISDIYFNTQRKNRKYVILTVCICVFLAITIINLFFQSSPIYQYIYFKIQQHSRGSHPILNGLLSGRIERIPKVRNIYNEKFSILTFLCGIGYPLFGYRLEMDFLEILYYFGFIIFLITVLYYFIIIYIAKRNKNYKLVVFNLIICLISFIAGHVVYSVMGGLFFAINNNIYQTKVFSLRKISGIFKDKKFITIKNLLFKLQ